MHAVKASSTFRDLLAVQCPAKPRAQPKKQRNKNPISSLGLVICILCSGQVFQTYILHVFSLGKPKRKSSPNKMQMLNSYWSVIFFINIKITNSYSNPCYLLITISMYQDEYLQWYRYMWILNYTFYALHVTWTGWLRSDFWLLSYGM